MITTAHADRWSQVCSVLTTQKIIWNYLNKNVHFSKWTSN